MSDKKAEKKPEGKKEEKFIVNDEIKKAIESYADLAAEAEKAKALYEDPKIGEAELKKRMAIRRAETLKDMTQEIDEVVEYINENHKKKAAEGKTLTITLTKGPVTIEIKSQKDVDHFLKTYLELDRRTLLEEKKNYEDMAAARPGLEKREKEALEKRYHDNVAKMEATLKAKEEAIKAAKAKSIKDEALPYFTDYDMAVLGDLNRAIADDGKQLIAKGLLPMSQHQLAINQHQYELRAYELRSAKDRATFNESRRIELVKGFLAQEQVALAAEVRGKPVVAKPPTVTETREPPAVMPPARGVPTEAPMPRLIGEPERAPMPRERRKPNAAVSVLEKAEQAALAALKGDANYESDFQPVLPAKSMARQKSVA